MSRWPRQHCEQNIYTHLGRLHDTGLFNRAGIFPAPTKKHLQQNHVSYEKKFKKLVGPCVRPVEKISAGNVRVKLNDNNDNLAVE